MTDDDNFADEIFAKVWAALPDEMRTEQGARALRHLMGLKIAYGLFGEDGLRLEMERSHRRHDVLMILAPYMTPGVSWADLLALATPQDLARIDEIRDGLTIAELFGREGD